MKALSRELFFVPLRLCAFVFYLCSLSIVYYFFFRFYFYPAR